MPQWGNCSIQYPVFSTGVHGVGRVGDGEGGAALFGEGGAGRLATLHPPSPADRSPRLGK